MSNNVKLFVRPNIGYDFQGWNEALFLPESEIKYKVIHKSKLADKKPEEKYLYELYPEIIFINSTTFGPILPYYVKDNWVECFMSKLSKNNVCMVGISCNFLNNIYDKDNGNIIILIIVNMHIFKVCVMV